MCATNLHFSSSCSFIPKLLLYSFFSCLREKLVLFLFKAKGSTWSHSPFLFLPCLLPSYLLVSLFLLYYWLLPSAHPLLLSCFCKDNVHVLASTDFMTLFAFFPSQLNFSRSVFAPHFYFSFQPIRMRLLLLLLKRHAFSEVSSHTS